jgi:hypothetical protein
MIIYLRKMKFQTGYSYHNTHAVSIQIKEDLDINLGFGDRIEKHQSFLSQILPPRSPDFIAQKIRCSHCQEENF